MPCIAENLEPEEVCKARVSDPSQLHKSQTTSLALCCNDEWDCRLLRLDFRLADRALRWYTNLFDGIWVFSRKSVSWIFPKKIKVNIWLIYHILQILYFILAEKYEKGMSKKKTCLFFSIVHSATRRLLGCTLPAFLGPMEPSWSSGLRPGPGSLVVR